MNRRSELPRADAVVHTIFKGSDRLPNTLSLKMTATSRSLEDEPPLGGGARTAEGEPATKPWGPSSPRISVTGRLRNTPRRAAFQRQRSIRARERERSRHSAHGWPPVDGARDRGGRRAP